MNFNFRFVLEKVSFCILCSRPVMSRSPIIDPTGNQRRSTRPVSIFALHYLVKRYCQKTSDNLKQLL